MSKFRRIVKLSESCFIINILDEGLKLCTLVGGATEQSNAYLCRDFGAAQLPPRGLQLGAR